MQILDERHRGLAERERSLMEKLIDFLRDFGAPQDDVELVRQTLENLEELFLLVVVGEFKYLKDTIGRCHHQDTSD